jgi:hypothetical protein
MRATSTLSILLVVLTGCSRGTPPAPEASHDAEAARTALVAVLDAWKKGEAKALAKRNPPIRFFDDDLVAGLRLADYEIEEPDLPIKLHEDVAVILELRDAKGKGVRREARYQVGTDPTLSVLRSDR